MLLLLWPLAVKKKKLRLLPLLLLLLPHLLLLLQLTHLLLPLQLLLLQLLLPSQLSSNLPKRKKTTFGWFFFVCKNRGS